MIEPSATEQPYARSSGYTLEAPRENGEFTLYRGKRDGDALRVLVVAPAAEHPSPQSLRQLEHEYSLAADLDPAWAALPLEVTRREGSTMLVLKDPGGEPLDQVLERIERQPLELTRALRIAIGLATALGRVHRNGLIHKDIKPANVLVDDDANVWLTGFGIASRLPHEYQPPAPPEVIAGTLPYMAPEQTGRMNRSIDARSDLYSMGITLYQMLTGSLPFAAADPLEWVHCHIARQPAPPAHRAAVPEVLSSLTMKLLAKNAEERYQTASGVEADLRRCLTEWESYGRIDAFPLGRHDASERLVIPEELYGREREIDTLLAAFERVVVHATPELVLVSGYSGVGKSSVVNELHKVLVPPRGLFAAGKFDQYKRDIPYTTLAQSFQSLVREILVKTEAELGQWRDALLEAVGPNGQLVVSLIPEVEFIIGKQLPVQDLPPQDAQNRFKMVFRRFLGAFARAEHPLVLFLDDLQWLDAATLELLEYLISDPDVRHVLLVGAYRDNEVSSSHPLLRMLSAIRKAGAKVNEIVLAPLKLDDVCQLVADAVHCDPDTTFPLAQVVHERTGGNPFFLIQFLTALTEEGLLAFDRDAAGWTWDLAGILAKGYTDNVVDLLVGKLKRLSNATQYAVQQLACLGNVVEIATLTLVHGESEEEIHAPLWDATRAGLILRLESSYAFLHDRVQEAAYTLISEGERAATHLRIGRVLASRTAPEEIEEKIFEIVNQLDRGAALIDAQDERERVAELNLVAGKRAKMSSAYASALGYLAAGRALLVDASWDHNYELVFALEFHMAECELLTASMAAAEARLSMLSQRARSVHQIAAVTRLRLALYTTLDRSDRGVEVCLEYLQRDGASWPSHPTSDEVRREYDLVWSQLGTRSIEELIELPLMEDPDSLAALEVLAEVVPPAVFTNQSLASLVICRMVNLSLERGNTDASCFAYVWLGIIAGPYFGDYKNGFRFGRLGYELVRQRDLRRFQTRTDMCFGSIVMPWTKHVRSGSDLTRRAFDAAHKMGDLTYACYCCNNLNTILLAAGDPLPEVQREAEHGLVFAQKARFGLVVDIITAQVGLIRTLRGLTPEFGSFNDGQFDELQFEHHLSSHPSLALSKCWYFIRKLQARFFAEDYASALDASVSAGELLWTSYSAFEKAEYHFYSALVRATVSDSASPDSRRQHLEALAVHQGQLELWAENCPENFGDRVALVGAESARLETRDVDAMRLYERAIQLAREHGFVHNEGLAHELAARFYLTRGLETIGLASLRNARNCYERWGALGKVKQLDKRFALWTHPITMAIDFNRAAFRAAAETGNLTFACYSMHQSVTNLLQRNSPLDEAWRESELALDVVRKAKYRDLGDVIVGQQHFIAAMQGRPPTFSAFSDGQLDDAAFEAQLTGERMPSMVCLYWILKLKARFLFGDYAAALEAANQAKPLMWTVQGQIDVLDYVFYSALTLAALYEQASGGEREFSRGLLTAHQEQLREWADNHPPTFSDKHALVSGEIARLEGRDTEAMGLYEQAIRSAREHGFVQNEGLANEVAARFYAARGLETIVDAYLRNARYCYRRWGADGKVRQLDQSHPRLRQESLRSDRTIGTPVEHLDLATVVKVSHVVSSEIDLKKLIDALMLTALEHAGAERGLLLLPQGDELRIEAEAITGHDTVEVLRRQTVVMPSVLPESILRYVIRTRESVLLDDASVPNQFSADAYIGERRSRSILCLPLIKQSKLIGVLYLENNLTPHVFTLARLAVLKLLSSQAAISLENARLYDELTEREARIRRLVDSNIIGIFIWNLEGRIVDANEAFLRILGYDREDLVSGATSWRSITPEEWRTADVKVLQELATKGTCEPFEKEYLDKNGSRVPVLVGAALLEQRDEGVAFVLDLTERKLAEDALRKSQAELLHVARVTTLGEMVASIAHEVSQPLTAVIANASASLRWLEATSPNLDKVREALSRIVRDGNRAGDVIGHIRALVKKGDAEKTPLNINDAIQEVVSLTHSEIQKSGATLKVKLGTGLSDVLGDRIQLQQVILNLLMNGIEAMNAAADRPRELLIRSSQLESDKVLVAVQDAGVGIDAQNLEKVFDTFYTTKPNGMGMGLAISRSIVEAHGGKLWASPNDGAGTTFQFTLCVGSKLEEAR